MRGTLRSAPPRAIYRGTPPSLRPMPSGIGRGARSASLCQHLPRGPESPGTRQAECGLSSRPWAGCQQGLPTSHGSDNAFIIGICQIYTSWIIEIGLMLKLNSASHRWRRCRAGNVAFTLFAPKSCIRPRHYVLVRTWYGGERDRPANSHLRRVVFHRSADQSASQSIESPKYPACRYLPRERARRISEMGDR